MTPFLDSELARAERDENALFRVIPVPLERTVSYGAGTGKGPAAILAASNELEPGQCINIRAQHPAHRQALFFSQGLHFFKALVITPFLQAQFFDISRVGLQHGLHRAEKRNLL